MKARSALPHHLPQDPTYRCLSTKQLSFDYCDLCHSSYAYYPAGGSDGVKVCFDPNWSNCGIPQIICDFADSKIINLNCRHDFSIFPQVAFKGTENKDAETRASYCSLFGVAFCYVWEVFFNRKKIYIFFYLSAFRSQGDDWCKGSE